MTGSSLGARGQTNLPVLAVALVVLTAVTGMTLAMAEGAYLSAERDADERATAVSLADRFVAADADVTRRENVLDAASLAEFSRADAERMVPAAGDTAVRLRVGDETLVDHGDPDGGTTIRRIALVAETDTWRAEMAVEDETLTVPRRTETVAFDVDGDVHTIRINDRPVAHDPSGIDDRQGPIRVDTSRYETVTVSAEGSDGSVGVEAFPEHTEKAVVAVTVDA